MIRKLPKYLFIHLKRFEYDLQAGIRHKLNSRCEFPIDEPLDMLPFTEAGIDAKEGRSAPGNAAPPNELFDLAGIVIHRGHANGGHYYSFVRNSELHHEANDASASQVQDREHASSPWIELNDSRVHARDTPYVESSSFGGFG